MRFAEMSERLVEDVERPASADSTKSLKDVEEMHAELEDV